MRSSSLREWKAVQDSGSGPGSPPPPHRTSPPPPKHLTFFCPSVSQPPPALPSLSPSSVSPFWMRPCLLRPRQPSSGIIFPTTFKLLYILVLPAWIVAANLCKIFSINLNLSISTRVSIILSEDPS